MTGAAANLFNSSDSSRLACPFGVKGRQFIGDLCLVSSLQSIRLKFADLLEWRCDVMPCGGVFLQHLLSASESSVPCHGKNVLESLYFILHDF